MFADIACAPANVYVLEMCESRAPFAQAWTGIVLLVDGCRLLTVSGGVPHAPEIQDHKPCAYIFIYAPMSVYVSVPLGTHTYTYSYTYSYTRTSALIHISMCPYMRYAEWPFVDGCWLLVVGCSLWAAGAVTNGFSSSARVHQHSNLQCLVGMCVYMYNHVYVLMVMRSNLYMRVEIYMSICISVYRKHLHIEMYTALRTFL